MSVNNASGIIFDNSIVMLQILASLTDEFIDVIYKRNVFIPRATRCNIINLFTNIISEIL
jgi:hypothetical protein